MPVFVLAKPLQLCRAFLVAPSGTSLLHGCVALGGEAGRGVVKDEEAALKWYSESAEQGNSSAQFVLGVYPPPSPPNLNTDPDSDTHLPAGALAHALQKQISSKSANPGVKPFNGGRTWDGSNSAATDRPTAGWRDQLPLVGSEYSVSTRRLSPR